MPMDIDDNRMPGMLIACITSWQAKYPKISFDNPPDTKNMKQSVEYLHKQVNKCIEFYEKFIFELSSKYKSGEENYRLFENVLITQKNIEYEYQIVYRVTGYMHYCKDKIYMNTNQNRDCIYVNCDDIITEVMAKNKNYSYFGK